MNRRAVIKGLLAGVAAGGFRVPLVHAADYTGKFFAFVQAGGGWDPTSFCDPKVNVSGEPIINHWAEEDDIRQAGNIPYAPFASNEAFFEKYHDRMLVINGVDAQTNSHTVGTVHNWSGRSSEGYPTTTALLAAHHGPDASVAYLTFGGFSYPAGVIRTTRLDNTDLLQALAAPATAPLGRYFSDADWTALETYAAETAKGLGEFRELIPSESRTLADYRSAFAAEGLKAFADAIDNTRTQSGLRRQAQLAVLGFRTGAAVSADLILGGFDTHANHDAAHTGQLAQLTEGVDYLWDFAEAEGIADRLVVVMGSDFGRTNYYNSGDGKDHWPIGSFVVMEKNQPWTDRAVGETDELHFAQRINPTTLEQDSADGTVIHPKHVHKALRRHLGVEASAGAERFPFDGTEDFVFFDDPGADS
ncbi:MAG: DUF1501 domain-containing protein [Gammaproteobacteria bacterium]|nr:DUF1501 domain-containing protein [Gammaproteobacteria bacterium]MYF27603.1 DUF1501 domain-containing protein [Gammaproteobacteria bacterium]MYK48124.1 DUF1501 domain-containing protein [Gammaproteobacteria bacterium]